MSKKIEKVELHAHDSLKITEARIKKLLKEKVASVEKTTSVSSDLITKLETRIKQTRDALSAMKSEIVMLS